MGLSDVSGIVLAGGRSSRMKLNKAFIQVGGIAIIERILPGLSRVCSETLIISNEPELYQKYGVPVYTDVYPRQGPVSGIHAGLFYANQQLAFFQSCDLPFMNPELAVLLKARIGSRDCAVPVVGGQMQPLAALFKKSFLPVFDDALRHGRLKLTRLLAEHANTCLVPEEELQELGDLDLLFLNVNDAATLKIAEQRARGL